MQPKVLSNNQSNEHYEIEPIEDILRDMADFNLKDIVSDMKKIGFDVTALRSKQEKGINKIYVTEKGVSTEIMQHELSAGFFRTLAFVIYIRYLLINKKVRTLLIDDICEGIDYTRSVQLAKFLLNISKEYKSIQFIITSNDSYLMDVIPLDCWNVLVRNKDVVQVKNTQNNPKLFKRFEKLGLNNFDFFSSDFIDKND